MMKRIYKYVFYAIFVAFLATVMSCGKPKVIPDGELSDIFVEMYLINAYTDRARIDYDSIDIYRPVLEKHGYTTDDFINTLGNFSKRKSARLAHIVDGAITKLDAQYNRLEWEVGVMESVDKASWELTKEVVRQDSVIEARKTADTAKLRIVMPVREGRYDITYYYKQGASDENGGRLSSSHELVDSLGKVLESFPERIYKEEHKLVNKTFNAGPDAHELRIKFANYPEKPKKIHFTVDSLVVVYYPPKDEARMKALRKFIDYRLTIDGKEYYEYYQTPAADSGALYLLPPLIAEERDTLPR